MSHGPWLSNSLKIFNSQVWNFKDSIGILIFHLNSLFFYMVIKHSIWDIFDVSLYFCIVMHLKFLILWFFVMTHTHDVINNGFEKGPQKSEKIWDSKLDDFLKFLTFVMSFYHITLGAYWFFFHRTLPDGQEIVHMIKFGKIYDSTLGHGKFLFFRFFLFVIKKRKCLFLFFFVF